MKKILFKSKEVSEKAYTFSGRLFIIVIFLCAHNLNAKLVNTENCNILRRFSVLCRFFLSQVAYTELDNNIFVLSILHPPSSHRSRIIPYPLQRSLYITFILILHVFLLKISLVFHTQLGRQNNVSLFGYSEKNNNVYLEVSTLYCALVSQNILRQVLNISSLFKL